MKVTSAISTVLLGLAPLSAAISVSGSAEGFAAAVTGGGDADPQVPSDINELKEWLTDDTPRVIVLEKEYDFTESEGTTSGTVCASWGSGDSCQKIIQDDCGDSPSSQETWYTAGTTGMDVGSNKTILGDGDKGIIKGKGLRFRDGVSNIIVQNIQISDLNPKYVWGGDALYFDGSDLIWIDHVTVRELWTNDGVRLLMKALDGSHRTAALHVRIRDKHSHYSLEQLHQRRNYILDRMRWVHLLGL